MSAIARMPEHSVLGASSAERWMNCPGSNIILKLLALGPSDDTDFSVEGNAAHDLGAHCLTTECDTWECIGMVFRGVTVDKEMADAVQLYLQTIRELIAEHGDDPHVRHHVEVKISDNSISDKFYGTADDVIDGPAVLDITDLKYGVGIAVDAIKNPQLMYYAVGVLARTIGARRVRMRIVQPRAFHPDGPIRVFEMDAAELLAWRDDVLISAMKRAETDKTLTPGEWCRFCPAKLVCPMLKALYKAMAEADPNDLSGMTDAQLGLEYTLTVPVMIRRKAVEEETFRRLSHGAIVPGTKLVPKKSWRVLTAEGAAEAAIRFGNDAYTLPELKSPAEIDKLGPLGKSFTKEFAYSPNTGLTVALDDDKRVAVKVTTAQEAFAGYKGPSQ